jgi:hypothetical protein
LVWWEDSDTERQRERQRERGEESTVIENKGGFGREHKSKHKKY